MKNLILRLIATFLLSFTLLTPGFASLAIPQQKVSQASEIIQPDAPAPGVSFFSLVLKTAKSSIRKVLGSLLLVNNNLRMAAAFIISAILLRILLYTVFRNGGSFTEILDIGTYVLVLVGIIFFILWFLEAASDF